MRPVAPPTCSDLPVSSSMWARSISTRKVSRRPPRRHDVHVAVEADRLVVLRGLEVLRHVRVEVVLPREPAPLRDLAVQRQPDPDRRLDGLAVDDRHRAGQAEAGRADLGVGLGAELGRAAAEHLRGGVELDVDLEAERRVVRREHVVEGDQGVGHAERSFQGRGLVEQRAAPLRRAARPRGRRRRGRAGRRRAPGARIWKPAGQAVLVGEAAGHRDARARRRGWPGWSRGR